MIVGKAKYVEFEHQHGEAYAIMTYKCANGHVEQIWNSRDGVTPFIVDCRRCDEDSSHITWEQDVYAPFHKPKKGDRIFVDLTLEKARQYRREFVDKYWSSPPYPMNQRWKTKEAAVEELAREDFKGGEAPDLVEVL